MTDNEIIKGLECCKTVDVKGCGDCPYRDENCVNRIMTDSLDLILKQKAEIETAKSEVERLQEEVNRYKRYFFRHDYDEMIAEVLDKLDRFINSNCIEIKDERGIKGYVTSGVHFAIAELKKKYTDTSPADPKEAFIKKLVDNWKWGEEE